MALKAKNEEQQEHVLAILNKKSHTSVIDQDEDGLYLDDFISYDEMAEIVDYLRTTDTMKDVFEECWVAYKRKGSKKKSLEYWKKLTDTEKQNVLPHIKAYVSTRDLQYQKDFERYLRDKIFQTVVFSGNNVVYDPTKLGKDQSGENVYMPHCGGALDWNEHLNCYIYMGIFLDFIPDGYNDDNRPDGARIMLNNGRGFIVWSSERKKWEKE